MAPAKELVALTTLIFYRKLFFKWTRGFNSCDEKMPIFFKEAVK